MYFCVVVMYMREKMNALTVAIAKKKSIRMPLLVLSLWFEYKCM